MKIMIRQDGCVGHARCHNAAPELYTLDDNGYIVSTGFEVPADLEAQARRGARACPERIIQVVEDETAAD